MCKVVIWHGGDIGSSADGKRATNVHGAGAAFVEVKHPSADTFSLVYALRACFRLVV
jgi:hypothetical protein